MFVLFRYPGCVSGMDEAHFPSGFCSSIIEHLVWSCAHDFVEFDNILTTNEPNSLEWQRLFSTEVVFFLEELNLLR